MASVAMWARYRNDCQSLPAIGVLIDEGAAIENTAGLSGKRNEALHPRSILLPASE
jgi:hypothetical protein